MSSFHEDGWEDSSSGHRGLRHVRILKSLYIRLVMTLKINGKIRSTAAMDKINHFGKHFTQY